MSQIVTNLINIDLTLLKTVTGTFVPDTDLELFLLDGYKLYTNDDDDYIERFTTRVLKEIYCDDKERPYEEILSFYKESEYINKIFKFISKVEILVLNSVDPDIINVRFVKYNKTTPKLIGVFEVTTYGKENK